ncbi:hypothetical protein OLK001_29730 [Synechocystis sp. LKSZ1]
MPKQCSSSYKNYLTKVKALSKEPSKIENGNKAKKRYQTGEYDVREFQKPRRYPGNPTESEPGHVAGGGFPG